MKSVVQCVTSSSVVVDGDEIARIALGLLVLVGIAQDDQNEDMEYMVQNY